MPTLKLYGANVCPFVHRARLALAEKGLEYEYVAIDLRDKPDWYDRVLPSGKVPLLEHAGNRVWESAVVCEYLEESFPTPALLPSDPGARARARIWIDWSSSALVPAFYKLLKSQDSAQCDSLKSELRGVLQKLEDALAAGPWLLGERLTLADLETYPWFERWPVLEHYRDFPLPSGLPNLARWREAMAGRPAVSAIAEPGDFYIEQYRVYARPAAAAAG
jgi:glutathione S-transferase